MNRALRIRVVRVLLFVLIAWIGGASQGVGQDKEARERIFKQGYDALTAGRLDESIASFRKCLELSPQDADCAYNMACSYTLKKDVDAGLEWLGKSIEWGYNDLDHLRQDPDLKALRQDARYQALVKQLQRRVRMIRTPEVTLDLIVMIEGSMGFGAGILFGKDRDRAYIATANHLVRKNEKVARELRVLSRMLPDTWIDARLMEHFSQEKELDLAVLSVDGFATRDVDVCSLPFNRIGDTDGLRRGNEVYPVGYPNAIRWGMPLKPDYVAQVSRPQIAFQSGFVRGGHSGGGLITARGDLVGMIRADEAPLAVATDLRAILDALRQWNYPVQLRRSNTPSPLFAAASTSDSTGVQRALQAPCVDVEERFEGWTALQKAAEKGATMIVADLLRAGAKPGERIDNPKYKDYSALQLAAGDGFVDIVRLLLDAGVRPDDTGGYRDTALALAVDEGHRNVVNALRRAGAKADFVRVPGVSDPTLRGAAGGGLVEVARLLIELGAPVNDVYFDGTKYDTALFAAIRNYQVDMVKFLLAAGADPNVMDKNRATSALSTVIFQSWHEENDHPAGGAKQPELLRIARMLIDAGARLDDIGGGGISSSEPEQRAEYRKTAIGLAVEYGQIELVKLLREKGANVNERNGEGRTALHEAAEMSRGSSTAQFEVLRLLLAAGADVNATDKYKDPPLCRALWGTPQHPRITIAEILLKAGARSLMMGQCHHQSGRSWAPDAALDRLLRSYGAKE